MNSVSVATSSAVLLRSVSLGLSLLAGASLSGCQNTSLGEQLQGAVAPKVSATPTAEPTNSAAPQPKPTATPEVKATTLPTPQTSPTATKNASSPSLISWLKVAQKTAENSLQQSKFLPVPILASRSFIPEDIDQAPVALQGYIRDLTQLGVINPRPGQTENTYSLSPNSPITRREYVRWLVTANNRFYANQPSRQLRLAQPADPPFFSDIPANDPDFAIIQGLANGGLLPANGDNGNEPTLFRPDEPITRQEMVAWKIPFDIRQPLPIANLEAVTKAWGFRDIRDLNTSNLGGFVADAQLGEQSNVRRAFGFTVLLQPNKNVTRAEAIATLWYFGTATDGLSARRVQQLEQASQASDRSEKPKTESKSEPKTEAKPEETPLKTPDRNPKP
jgi:hypothetical protein